jgi:TonB-dependent starch-binding outer membrane protein SusC
MRKNIVLFIIAVLSIGSISAQKTTRRLEIKGNVKDVYNSPVSNAIITLDDQKTGTVTDSRGYYIIKVKRGISKIGVFSFGNGTLETNIDGRTVINFNFSTIGVSPNSGLRDGDQAVGTGYGMVKKRNLTTDVSNIDGNNDKYASYSSLQEMIQREVSGVQVNGSDIVIQGSQDMMGNVHPLIVLDGVYMDQLPDIPPVTVSSIEVLKGTSASIYGSRAFGGAIVIKTKVH